MASPNRSPYETALLLGLLLKRSEKARARISELTLKKLGGRALLRESFLAYLKYELEELSIVMSKLKRGGFALVDVSSLEGAPAITAKFLLADTLKELKSGAITFSDIEDELGIDLPPSDEDE
ncbi:hypothetical protein [Janthinobacterium sp. HH107]|uniref:hypothetical protein n=1 Tax=Janthinobacterium sp. HH107 TaxID=1537279 RepID=UPI00114CC867|nr:hypothetical protein [Janthinobacterium sp. HH107]